MIDFKSDPARDISGTLLTRLILELFALNNRLLTTGDRMVGGLGLTSARWQVLGFMAEGGKIQPVAWIARDMGANRQNIQRIVNDLAGDDLVRFEPNPHHRRAQLVALTDKGHAVYQAALRIQKPWVDNLAEGIPVAEIDAALALITALRVKLERADGPDQIP
jgi:DNA-binding MarR family transcriptional regulator